MILLQRLMLRRQYIFKIHRFSLSTKNGPLNKLEELSNRSLVKVEGTDSANFLQGLITNDINFLPLHGYDSMYTMFLNSKGRVISDSIIYKIPDAFLIECDTSILTIFMNHLRMYKLRKQITIESFSNHKIYALFNERNIDEQGNLEQLCYMTCNEKASSFEDYCIFSDPRLKNLGHRIITEKLLGDLKDKLDITITNQNGHDYKWLRYNLGVGEGVSDIPPTNCFPLESNVDYLHGINFHKGCYIGQELTARTYHTGVTRKRLMPLFFDKELQREQEIHDINTKNNERLGKLRGTHGNVGLGLLYYHKAITGKFFLSDCEVEARIPHWWPKTNEQNKQEMSLN